MCVEKLYTKFYVLFLLIREMNFPLHSYRRSEILLYRGLAAIHNLWPEHWGHRRLKSLITMKKLGVLMYLSWF
jgi:hypothetical protein